jgi:hypothetical protein
MMSELSNAYDEAVLSLQNLIDLSDEDLSMWDACSDFVPPEAEKRHANYKAALARLLDDAKTLAAELPPAES